jgi:Family of unknown function (DUF6308)
MKRRHLVPVIDSYVKRALQGQLSDTAAKATRAAQATFLIKHLRVEGRRLRPQLEAIQGHLAVAQIPVHRSLARILDVLVWTSEDPGWKAIGEMLVRYREEDTA